MSGPAARSGRALGALLLVAALLGGVLTACSSGSTGAPTDAQVRAALARHAEGVLKHHRNDFLAAIDTGAKAADFRDDQSAQYDNLITVPLASWSYSLGARVTDRSAQAAARKALECAIDPAISCAYSRQSNETDSL